MRTYGVNIACCFVSRRLSDVYPVCYLLYGVSHCFADSNSFVDDTDVEFRSRVEKIRQIGGDSWLKIFDEIQGEEEMTLVCT